MRFNRRRDACFPATMAVHIAIRAAAWVSIADATLASPQQQIAAAIPYPVLVSIADATLASPQRTSFTERKPVLDVSIADATLASPQLSMNMFPSWRSSSVSIADATLASPQPVVTKPLDTITDSFNRRRDACFPATNEWLEENHLFLVVSIADATLASPQQEAFLAAPVPS